MRPLTLAVTFTNFGPYHLARLRALASLLNASGGHLIAYEMAGTERLYPWRVDRSDEPFDWISLFPERPLESLSPAACSEAQRDALDRDVPDVVAAAGYVRPESLAALSWARLEGKPAILMSESGRLDRKRVWWKEAVKARRVRRFSAALVGGPRHRDYLVELGMPADRIAFGYNVVDNEQYARAAESARSHPEGRAGLPNRPYFLSVCRFAPEKNLLALIEAFALYRREAGDRDAWDLVLCGDGPESAAIEAAIRAEGLEGSIRRPGFLQADGVARLYAYASAFVLPSLSEPWGLVVNEAAACGLPLLVSDRAGCVDPLVPDLPATTGRRFSPLDRESLAASLAWMAGLDEEERHDMGRRAAAIVADWGPGRFAEGMIQAVESAYAEPKRSGATVFSHAESGDIA